MTVELWLVIPEAVCLVVAAVTFILILRFRRELKGWRKVTGTIFHVTSYPAVSDDDVTIDVCEVEFRDDKGFRRVVSNVPMRLWDRPFVGVKVPVVFPPSAPYRARIGTTKMVYGYYGLVFCFAISLAVALLICMLLSLYA